jgi:hypothetical protein
MRQLDSFVDGIARRLSESDRLLSYGSCRRGAMAVFENLFGPDVRSYKPSDQHPCIGSLVFAFLTSGFVAEVVYHDTDEWISHSEVFHDADIDFWVSLDADLLYSLFKPEE